MQNSRQPPRHASNLGPTLALLSILLLGLGLRLYRLGDQNIWWDEGHAIWAARQSLYEATRVTAYDVHPPLYLWLLHIWLRWTGESEFAVRYLSLIGGTLTVALTYVVARRLIGRRAALLATLLIATARFHIWWSQEARMYVWAAFLALLSVYLFARLRQGGARVWWSYVLASAASLYTLYLSALVLFLQNLFFLLTVWRKPRRRRFLFTWALSQLGIALLYLPWLTMALPRIRSDTAKAPFAFYRVWQLYGIVLATGISTDLDRYTWLLIVFGLLVVSGIALLVFDRSQPQRYGFASWEIGLLLALLLVLPPLVVYGLSIPRGFFYSPKPEARYLLLFAPFFYILIAGTMVGLGQKGRWGRLASTAAVVLVLGTFVAVLPTHYAGRYLRDDYHTAMRTLAAYARPSDAVLLVSGDRYPVFLYHYNRQFPNGDGPEVYLMPQHNKIFTLDNVDSELGPLHEGHARLWLASFERSLQDPQDVVEGWLDANRKSVLNVAQGYNYLRLYTVEGMETAVGPETARPQHPITFALDDGLLLGYDLPTDEFRPSDVVQLGLYFEVQNTFELVVHWIDQAGRSVAHQDISVVRSGDNPLARVLVSFAVYEYTKPGQYRFGVGSPHHVLTTFPAGQVTHSRQLPKGEPAVPLEVQVGGGAIQLVGYTLKPVGQVRAGQSLTIDLYWRVKRSLDQDYTVFAHLLGPYNSASGGPVWAQDDSYPLNGGHPTSRWLEEQVVIDRRSFQVPVNAPPGAYQIEVGMYDLRTGDRLPVSGDQANRVLLAEVQVQKD